ncbi:hypothetical protein JCM10213_002449 [Rhodosporidiobolus nylandii]
MKEPRTSRSLFSVFFDLGLPQVASPFIPPTTEELPPYDAPGAPASPHKREQRTPPSGAHSSSDGPEQVDKDAASPRHFLSPSPGPSSEPPSPSAARKRSRADTSVAISDHSDLSELSSVEESDSEGSGVETEDGDEEGKQGDDGHKRAGGVTITSAADLPVTDVWPRAANEALVRGLELIPSLGVYTTRRIRNHKMGRNGLLSEYIRRQIGLVFSRGQVHNKLQRLRSVVDGHMLVLLKGAPAEPSSYRHRDWDAFLGPDLHPHTLKKPNKHGKEKKRSTTSREPKKRKREEQPASSHLPQPLEFPYIPDFPPVFPSYSHPAYPPPTPQQPAYLSHPYSQPLPAQQAIPPPPSFSFSHAQPSSSTSSLLSASDLSAFFTSFCPSHSFTSSAAALHSSGLCTPDDLFRLVALENETLAALLDELWAKAKVSMLEKAWLKRAVEEGRKALAGGI